MAHNQEMLEKRGAEWGDKVRLIGLSIDNDVGTVKNHVKTKGWEKVEHYHVRNGKCTADKDYGVQGVPHVLLVDTHGKIVFMGHPASRKIEEDIDKLLKDEKLTGEGTKGTGADDEEDSGSKKVATTEEILKFKSDTAEWVTKVKDKCSSIQRAFLVMTSDQALNLDDGTLKTKTTTVHTVLMGPKEAVDVAHEECKKHNQGNWENRDQVRGL